MVHFRGFGVWGGGVVFCQGRVLAEWRGWRSYDKCIPK